MYLLVTIRTDPRGLIVFCAVVIGAIVEGTIASAYGPTTSLVHEMPIETCERPMLGALVLQEERALLHAKLFQIAGKQDGVSECLRHEEHGRETLSPVPQMYQTQNVLTSSDSVFPFGLSTKVLPLTAFCNHWRAGTTRRARSQRTNYSALARVM